MKLWLLRPVKDLPDGDNPWEPWYDKCFGFVVRAKTEDDARQIAHAEAGDENRKSTPWLDPKYSTCEPLVNKGDAGMIIQDVASA